MTDRFRQLGPQPATGIIIVLLAALVLVAGFGAQPDLGLLGDIQAGIIAVFLAAGIVGAGLHPIHVRHNIKVLVTTVPIYTAVLLLPPVVAAAVAGGSMLVLEILTRAQRGNTPSDIATASGRWVIVAFICSSVAQSTAYAQLALPLALVGVAAIMFVSDIVTGALEIAPMSGESPVRLMVTLLREATLAEAMQYLLGMLVVLAALDHPWSLALWPLPLIIVYRSFRHAKEMHEGTSKLLESLADAVDLRDPYTGGHSRRVTDLSLQILRAMAIVGPEVDLIRSAARVHDIGKIGIPDHILNKPGRLTDDERQIMESHPERGAELLMRYRDFARGMEIVRHHHERWDGQGYPSGLSGVQIPFGARVIAVADSFDAMTSDRPYRAGMPVSKAAAILRDGRNEQWDPAIVDALLRSLEAQAPETKAPPLPIATSTAPIGERSGT